MDFVICKHNDKVIVRVKANPSNVESVNSFCQEYKQHLLDAEQSKIKLSLLFDLRCVTLAMLGSNSSRLQTFFGVELHDLSERTIRKCMVVIKSKTLAMAFQVLLDAFPGSIPTSITTVYPTPK